MFVKFLLLYLITTILIFFTSSQTASHWSSSRLDQKATLCVNEPFPLCNYGNWWNRIPFSLVTPPVTTLQTPWLLLLLLLSVDGGDPSVVYCNNPFKLKLTTTTSSTNSPSFYSTNGCSLKSKEQVVITLFLDSPFASNMHPPEHHRLHFELHLLWGGGRQHPPFSSTPLRGGG